MATFHPFPRLPLELRIRIWASAIEESRLIKVRKTWHRNQGYYSPTAIPGVTRASRESREHCSYRKGFTLDSSPRYIWVNFENDIIQMRSGLVLAKDGVERDLIKRLRIELVNENDLEEPESFYFHVNKIRDFPNLRMIDVLVSGPLAPQWTEFIKESNWGACSPENVRIVDRVTGEWIDIETSGPYQDYLDTNGGENENYTRDAEDWEDEVERAQAVKLLQMPLPRIDLNY